MDARGMTKADLSRATGIAPPNVTRFFQADSPRGTSIITLKRIAAALSVTWLDLVTPDPPEPPLTEIPLIGVVGAGPGQDNEFPPGTTIRVGDLIPVGCVAYEVRGLSMVDDLIGNGDYLLVQPNPSPESGDIVVAWLHDEGMMVKRLKIDDGEKWLESSSNQRPRYQSRSLTDRDVVHGVYVACVRRGKPPKKERTKAERKK